MTALPEDMYSVEAALESAGLSSPLNVTRIGEHRGFTSRCYIVGYGQHHLVAKVTSSEHIHPKAVRETDILKRFRGPAHLPAPNYIGAQVCNQSGDHVLLMNAICGDEVDTMALDSHQTLQQALQRMVPCWDTPIQDLPESQYLSRWGAGTQSHSHPHARRVRRFKKHASAFVDNYSKHESSAPEIPCVIRWMCEHFERCLDVSAQWPLAMIHGDLHPENIIVGNQDITILDWQTASFGSPLFDISRLLMDAAPTLTADEFIKWTHTTLSQCTQYIQQDDTTLNATSAGIAAVVGYAGFVSGWGGKKTSSLSPREHLLVKHHASIDGPTRLIKECISKIESSNQWKPNDGNRLGSK